MLIKFIAWFYWLINFLICSTLKFKIVCEPSGHMLFAFWHGKHFPLLFWSQHRKLCVFPIDNWQGEIIDYLANKYKQKTVRLKIKANPLERSRNLANLKETIDKGYSGAIAVDGPPKPMVHHKAKPGIIFLSRSTGLPIVPVSINMKRKIILFWRWDRYEVPLPFSEVEIKFGKPFMADEKTTTEELERALTNITN